MQQRAIDDPHLHYLNGLDLYGQRDFDELPLPDQLHADGPTHRRIGNRFLNSRSATVVRSLSREPYLRLA